MKIWGRGFQAKGPLRAQALAWEYAESVGGLEGEPGGLE